MANLTLEDLLGRWDLYIDPEVGADNPPNLMVRVVDEEGNFAFRISKDADVNDIDRLLRYSRAQYNIGVKHGGDQKALAIRALLEVKP